MAVLSKLDVDMTNLHAAGTSAMMEAAIEGLTRPDGTRPQRAERPRRNEGGNFKPLKGGKRDKR